MGEGDALVAPLSQALLVAAMTGAVDQLELVGDALTVARELSAKWPVTFTRGRTTPAGQAQAMAEDLVASGKGAAWISGTYKASYAASQCVAAVCDMTHPLTVASVQPVLLSVLEQLTDDERAKLSRHFAGCAFDVHRQPDELWWGTMVHFLDLECRALGGKLLLEEAGEPMCHAQFKVPALDEHTDAASCA
jgi:hypothetical protein